MKEKEWVQGMPLLIEEAVAHLSQAHWGMAKGSRSVKLFSCTHDISITQQAFIVRFPQPDKLREGQRERGGGGWEGLFEEMSFFLKTGEYSFRKRCHAVALNAR